MFQVHVRHHDPAATAAATDLMKLVGTVGDPSRTAGLDGDVLSRRMGYALGEAVATDGLACRLERRDALEKLTSLVTQCSLGRLTVVSLTPLVLRVEVTASPLVPQGGGRRCAHIAGFLEGALGVLLGKIPGVREIDCVNLGNSYCTFACEM